jgi:hypothetical protein
MTRWNAVLKGPGFNGEIETGALYSVGLCWLAFGFVLVDCATAVNPANKTMTTAIAFI